MIKKERVIVYIDGFNMYFGMKEAALDKYKWLNLYNLSIDILKQEQELVAVKYFTSSVSNDPDKQKRQITFIEALESTGIKIIYGHYQRGSIECKRCGFKWATFSEKKTDVNIATQLMSDAFSNLYDTAILISGDSDLVPPIDEIKKQFLNKRVIIAFPPRRFNNSVALAADGYFMIGKRKIEKNQFPEQVIKKDGYVLHKPTSWQ